MVAGIAFLFCTEDLSHLESSMDQQLGQGKALKISVSLFFGWNLKCISLPFPWHISQYFDCSCLWTRSTLNHPKHPRNWIGQNRAFFHHWVRCAAPGTEINSWIAKLVLRMHRPGPGQPITMTCCSAAYSSKGSQKPLISPRSPGQVGVTLYWSHVGYILTMIDWIIIYPVAWFAHMLKPQWLILIFGIGM